MDSWGTQFNAWSELWQVTHLNLQPRVEFQPGATQSLFAPGHRVEHAPGPSLAQTQSLFAPGPQSAAYAGSGPAVAGSLRPRAG